jgi:predicted GNAT superfamily acetyltransferase
MQTLQHKFEIKEESLVDKIETELPVLLKEHWEEVAKNKEVMVLKPNIEMYKKLEDANNLLSIFAYADGYLVGYSCSFIIQHLHYADLCVCQNDIIFLNKEYRDTILGLKLIKETEKRAKERGAKLILWHAKKDSSLDKILPRMGCSLQEVVHSKQL